MSQAERGLFERIESCISIEFEEGQMPHCDRRSEIEISWPEIKAICIEMEQRLVDVDETIEVLRDLNDEMSDRLIARGFENTELNKRLAEAEKKAAIVDAMKAYDGSDDDAEYESPHPVFLICEERDAFMRICNDRQAKIDALMLEYCPDEMTTQQKENWANNQKLTAPLPEKDNE